MTKKPTLLERLKHCVLLADGAMGTLLHRSGISMDECFDAMNLQDPDAVLTVHRQFLAAGAELLETNSFGANRFKLTDHGYESQVAEINAAAVRLAKQAIAEVQNTGDRVFYVGGAVGPLGIRLAPFGRTQPEQAYAAFHEQISALIGAGVDVIVLETFTDLHEIEQAIKAARAINPNIPVLASMTFTRDDRTLYGDAPREVAQSLTEFGADVIGVNCSGGPSQLARIGQIMRAVEPDVLISVMPNAGFPEYINGRVMYPATPAYFGDYALAFRNGGMNIIGGCCGTTPDHIRAMREALDNPDRQPIIVLPSPGQNGHEFAATDEQPTPLAQKLAAGKFVFTVEMAPPRSFTAQKVIAAAQMLRDAGADMINVSDSPMARMRMSPWAVCHLIQDRLQMDTTLHFPTRGRNLLRVQGDLLAAHALDIRNIFVVMGDPTNIGDYPEAYDKYDIVPSGLVKLIKRSLNVGKDQAGNSIGQPTSFFVGTALNLCPPDIDAEIKTLRKKIEAGADFALTQTVFEPPKVRHFLDRYEELHGKLTLPILVGMLPLYGARHAAFLHNEVPGIVIPDPIMKRITAAGDQAPQVGIEIACELLRELDGMVQGAYLMPPFAKYEMAAEIVEHLLQPA
ncbi:MAG: bifunctional homocysteine S-methyltransferase/methylenetetrahydrofolate reductase [Anaerolineae bacterium]|nr:bifunctional homocysteine S-methyltransferase/methylenetetrahydrofolate reductase [Anaerolineae bacterium]